MRKVVYQTLLRAPFRVAGASMGVGSFVGSVWPDRVKTVIGGDTVTIQGVSIALLTLAALYFLLLWLLKPGERDSAPAAPPGPSMSPQTSAPLSPAIAAGRDVHYYPPPSPAERQDRKTDHYGIDPRRGASPVHPEYPLAGRPQEYPLSSHQGPKPDMELREVCDRLYDSLGGPPKLIDDFEARVDRKIRDGVRHWRLLTWGRKNNPNAGLDFVWGDAWLKGNFKHTKGWVRFKHPDNPRYIHEWADLHFNRAEVDAWLPPKDGRSEIGGY